MKLTLQIPDDVYDRLKKSAKGNYPKDVEEEILRRLQQFLDIPRGERVIMLHGPGRQAIEAYFEGPLDSPEHLLTQIRHFGLLKIGEIEVQIPADVLALLGEQARFHGTDANTYLRETVAYILKELVNRA
jgi:hypothetical protein